MLKHTPQAKYRALPVALRRSHLPRLCCSCRPEVLRFAIRESRTPRLPKTWSTKLESNQRWLFCRQLTYHLSIRAKITSASCMFRTDWLPSSAPAYRFTRATLHATYELGAEGGNRTLKISQWVLGPPRLPVSPQPQKLVLHQRFEL